MIVIPTGVGSPRGERTQRRNLQFSFACQDASRAKYANQLMPQHAEAPLKILKIVSAILQSQ